MTFDWQMDHLGVVVADTEIALRHFRDELGMSVAEEELIEVPPLRLTYLHAGATTLQLVEPLPGNDALRSYLEAEGEGIHHVCFLVTDLLGSIRELSGGREPELVIEGAHRRSAFLPGQPAHGVRIELTQER